MKAEELFAIVQDVPREAWPQLADGDSIHFIEGWWRTTRKNIKRVGVFYPDEAALMFEASMTKWLCDKMAGVTIGPCRDGGYGVVDTWQSPYVKTKADTLIGALAAACKAVRA